MKQLAIRLSEQRTLTQSLVIRGNAQGTLRVPYRRAARPAFPRGAWERCNAAKITGCCVKVSANRQAVPG